VLNGFGAAADEQARLNAMNYLRTIDRGHPLIAAASNITQQAIDLSKTFNVDPTLTTVFPNTSLGNQLKQVAKLIKFNSISGAPTLARQIVLFFIGRFRHAPRPDRHSGKCVDAGGSGYESVQNRTA